jgi:hypothetical protein
LAGKASKRRGTNEDGRNMATWLRVIRVDTDAGFIAATRA